MRRLASLLILVGTASLCGFLVQDPPLPTALHLEFSEAPETTYVAGRPATFSITVLDQHGRPAPINGLVAVLTTTDSRSRLSEEQVPLVNGVGTATVQWFTSGTHSIHAATKEGLKGGLTGVIVQDLPAGTKIELKKPMTWPGFAPAGAVMDLEVDVSSGDDTPIHCVEVSIKASNGVCLSPTKCFTEDNSGHAGLKVFTPRVERGEDNKPEVKGDAPMKLTLFIDVNGNGVVDTGEPTLSSPDIQITNVCPQQLIPASLAILKLLEQGGEAVIDLFGSIHVISAENATKVEKRKIKRAVKSLEQLIKWVEKERWRGQFSEVEKRLTKIKTPIENIDGADFAAELLEEAAFLTGHAPDVKGIKLSLQDKLGDRISVPVGFKDRVEIQPVDKDGQVLDEHDFFECFNPRFKKIEATGDAKLNPPFRPMEFGYECIGEKDVKMDIQLVYDFQDIDVFSSDSSAPIRQVKGNLISTSTFETLAFTQTARTVLIRQRGKFFMQVRRARNGGRKILGGAEKLSPGAFTIANLNDSDNDGLRDVVEGSMTTGNGFRVKPEKDLISVRFVLPSGIGADEPIILTGNAQAQALVKIWDREDQIVGKGFPKRILPGGTLVKREQFRFGGMWIEGLAKSASIGDVVITATIPKTKEFDKLVVTFVWAEFNDFRTNKTNGLKGHDDALNTTPQASYRVFYGAFTNQILEPDSTKHVIKMFDLFDATTQQGRQLNAAEFCFDVFPKKGTHPTGLGGIPSIQFDMTQQVNSKNWDLRRGRYHEFKADSEDFPDHNERANDDSNRLNEDDTPDAMDRIYGWDAPGNRGTVAPVVDAWAQLLNAKTFVRVRFDADDFANPVDVFRDGDGVQGTRCSKHLEWISHMLAGRNATGDLVRAPNGYSSRAFAKGSAGRRTVLRGSTGLGSPPRPIVAANIPSDEWTVSYDKSADQWRIKGKKTGALPTGATVKTGPFKHWAFDDPTLGLSFVIIPVTSGGTLQSPRNFDTFEFATVRKITNQVRPLNKAIFESFPDIGDIP